MTLPLSLSALFPPLYLLGFAVAVAVTLRRASATGAPAWAWAQVLAACVLGGVLGSRLIHFDLVPALPGEKTVLGGLVGGALIAWLAPRALRFRRADPDALALAIPLGHSVGRLGCFLAGCCFGQPTGGGWGVRYAPGSEPFAAQVSAGLIPADAAATLAVHPTQLYEVALQLTLAALLLHARPRLRARGSLLLVALAGYGVIRFGVEFLRWGDDAVAGLRVVQWTVGAATLALLLLLAVRERSARRASAPALRPSGAPARPSWLLAGAPAAALLLGHGWLTPLEGAALAGAALLSAAGLAAAPAFTRTGRARGPWGGRVGAAYPGLAGLAVLALLQVADPPEADDDAPPPYTVVGASATTGAYVETCGSARRYGLAGASIARVTPTGPHRSVTVKGQVFAGRDEEAARQNAAEPDYSDLGASEPVAGGAGSLALDFRYVGVEAGLAAGNLTVDGERAQSMPLGALRLGTLSGLFAEGRIGGGLDPIGVPGPLIQVGVGGGVGDHAIVRAGVSGSGFYASVLGVTAGGWELEPFLAVGDADTWQLAMAVRKRLGGRYDAPPPEGDAAAPVPPR